MRRIDAEQLRSRSVSALGLDPTKYSLTSVEAIAGALRRAASFLCPCPEASLVHNVLEPLRGLVSNHNLTKTLIEGVLDRLIAYGDLFEYRDFSHVNSAATVLYLAPLSFVPRNSGAVFLTGIGADHVLALPSELEARIETRGCVRTLTPLPGETLRDTLLESRLIEIPYEKWAKAPSARGVVEHIAKYDQLLREGPSSGDIPGLMVLDAAATVDYYPARWIGPKGRTGCYVARRNPAYGAPLWCYVQLEDGVAKYMVDFPTKGSRWRGCDEAWHLQMAIDAHRGVPQKFKLSTARPGSYDLHMYSPLPMWAERRWEAIGTRIEAANCLLAFRFPQIEIDEERHFAVSSLWLAQVGD